MPEFSSLWIQRHPVHNEEGILANNIPNVPKYGNFLSSVIWLMKSENHKADSSQMENSLKIFT